MTDRPILFSAPMVRALLDGRKTQTRRLLRNPEHWGCPTGDCPHNLQTECNESMASLRDEIINYRAGDRLWVKETWSHTGIGVWSTNDCHYARDGEAIYRATDDRPGASWFPSIFMFRKFSRLTLTITDVRVERLQDITHADAIAEGINCYQFYPSDDHPLCDGYSHVYPDDKKSLLYPTAIQAYAALWNSINGKDAWEQNPWIVALTSTVINRNIDR